MPAAENTRSRHRADNRRSPSESVHATRRGAHPASSSSAADGGSARGTTEPVHVTPNAIMAARGGWDFTGVKRFAHWLTDGATDRPHLRF